MTGLKASAVWGRAQIRKNHLRATLSLVCNSPPSTEALRREAILGGDISCRARQPR